jgi:hypothetical protein
MGDETNKHIWDYLGYYLNLGHAPGFAVLLSGPWGVGKTYLLKALLRKEFCDDPASYVYVSLYGLSSIEEIDDALFQAAFPALTGTAAKVVGRLAKVGLKFLKVEPSEWDLKDFLNKFRATVYVFDDLERCEAPINKVLGYINQFVEHGSAKVIILANEKEISDGKDYTRRREKLIGKTLHVSSVFGEAFEHFTLNIDHAATRSFIKGSTADIATVYAQSKVDNLRILQQTMWDFERFYAALLPEHQANHEAMATLLRLLFALSFELKAARIAEADIAMGRGASARLIAALEKDKPKTPMALAGDRYPMVDVDDNILSNALLVDYLVRGIVDADAIRKDLNASRFFINVADEQPWRTVWHWFERSDAEVTAALAKMEEQFKNRKFTKDGEILHVLGLRLFLSSQGLLELSKADVVAQGKQYIDDVSAAGKLEVPPSGDSRDIRLEGWGGLGISEQDTNDYTALFDYLISAIQRSVEGTYPQKAKDLLSAMKSDVDSFYRQISLSHADATNYVLAPVLAKLSVGDFVSAFFDLHPSEQRVAMAALKGRYEFDRLNQSLKEEKPWITSVHDAFRKRLPGMSPIARHRLEKQLQWYLKAV